MLRVKYIGRFDSTASSHKCVQVWGTKAISAVLCEFFLVLNAMVILGTVCAHHSNKGNCTEYCNQFYRWNSALFLAMCSSYNVGSNNIPEIIFKNQNIGIDNKTISILLDILLMKKISLFLGTAFGDNRQNHGRYQRKNMKSMMF